MRCFGESKSIKPASKNSYVSAIALPYDFSLLLSFIANGLTSRNLMGGMHILREANNRQKF